MATVIEVTEATFEQEILRSEFPALVDLWAEWCAPCKMMTPIVHALAEKLDGKVKVAQVDVQDNAELAVRYGVISIPTLLLFVDGEVREKLTGYVPEAAIMQRLAPYLD